MMDPNTYTALALKSAINLYLNTGIRANKAYTPSAMARAVSRYTGKTYPGSRKGLIQARTDLAKWLAPLGADEP